MKNNIHQLSNTHPCEPLSTSDDLGETSEDDVSDLPEGRIKHNFGFLYPQFDDHDLCLDIL